MKFLVALVLFVALVAASNKIAPEVERELSLKGNFADIFVEIGEKVDFSLLQKDGKKVEEMDEISQGRFVLDTLMSFSMVTQAKVAQFLKSKNLKFQAYYVDNVIYVEQAPKEIIEQLAQFVEVSKVSLNVLVDFEMETPIDIKVNTTSPAGIEWNVEHVKAPAAWAKGYKGNGIVIANSDTGIKWDVPALKNSYRGNKNGVVNHDYNWFDPSTAGSSKTPVDTHGHGTHCMGTKVGEDGQNKVGMAPKATWIGCRSLGPGASRNTVLRCLEFFLAPFDVNGRNPNADKRPHISSHSYLCGNCQLDTAVKNLKTAGIAVVVANGNSGPRCNSVTHPADIKESFAVGALAYRADTIASFSSRGPNRNGVIKPDISAPGSQVRSCTPNGYQSMSGTSMAAPAVAGVYALLWEAVPQLKRKPAETEKILLASALKQSSNGQCNSDKAPNNVFGMGTVNIDAAIKIAKQIYQQ
jgi:subtilisin family serine protease